MKQQFYSKCFNIFLIYVAVGTAGMILGSDLGKRAAKFIKEKTEAVTEALKSEEQKKKELERAQEEQKIKIAQAEEQKKRYLDFVIQLEKKFDTYKNYARVLRNRYQQFTVNRKLESLQSEVSALISKMMGNSVIPEDYEIEHTRVLSLLKDISKVNIFAHLLEAERETKNIKKLVYDESKYESLLKPCLYSLRNDLTQNLTESVVILPAEASECKALREFVGKVMPRNIVTPNVDTGSIALYDIVKLPEAQEAILSKQVNAQMNLISKWKNRDEKIAAYQLLEAYYYEILNLNNNEYFLESLMGELFIGDLQYIQGMLKSLSVPILQYPPADLRKHFYEISGIGNVSGNVLLELAGAGDNNIDYYKRAFNSEHAFNELKVKIREFAVAGVNKQFKNLLSKKCDVQKYMHAAFYLNQSKAFLTDEQKATLQKTRLQSQLKCIMQSEIKENLFDFVKNMRQLGNPIVEEQAKQIVEKQGKERRRPKITTAKTTKGTETESQQTTEAPPQLIQETGPTTTVTIPATTTPTTKTTTSTTSTAPVTTTTGTSVVPVQPIMPTQSIMPTVAPTLTASQPEGIKISNEDLTLLPIWFKGLSEIHFNDPKALVLQQQQYLIDEIPKENAKEREFVEKILATYNKEINNAEKMEQWDGLLVGAIELTEEQKKLLNESRSDIEFLKKMYLNGQVSIFESAATSELPETPTLPATSTTTPTPTLTPTPTPAPTQQPGVAPVTSPAPTQTATPPTPTPTSAPTLTPAITPTTQQPEAPKQPAATATIPATVSPATTPKPAVGWGSWVATQFTWAWSKITSGWSALGRFTGLWGDR